MQEFTFKFCACVTKQLKLPVKDRQRSSGLVVLVLDNGLRNGDVVVEMLDLPVCLFQTVNVNL